MKRRAVGRGSGNQTLVARIRWLPRAGTGLGGGGRRAHDGGGDIRLASCGSRGRRAAPGDQSVRVRGRLSRPGEHVPRSAPIVSTINL